MGDVAFLGGVFNDRFFTWSNAFSWKSLEASWAAVIMLHMQERWDVRPHYTSFPLAVC